MERPPRDVEQDRLVSGAVLRYAYSIVGWIEVGRLLQSGSGSVWEGCYRRTSLMAAIIVFAVLLTVKKRQKHCSHLMSWGGEGPHFLFGLA